MHIQFSHGSTEKCPKINFISMPKGLLLLGKKKSPALLGCKIHIFLQALTETASCYLGLEL